MTAKNFRNKLFLLPKPILREVNELIDQGLGPNYVKRLLKKRCDNDDDIASKPTIKKYIDWYKGQDQGPETLIEKEQTQLDNTKTEIVETNKLSNSKKEALETLAEKCYTRLKKLERLDLSQTSASLEHCIVNYSKEIRKIMETLLKLSGELQSDNSVVVNLINQRLGSYFKAVANTVKEVYGTDKLPLFKETLKRKLNEYQRSEQDFE